MKTPPLDATRSRLRRMRERLNWIVQTLDQIEASDYAIFADRESVKHNARIAREHAEIILREAINQEQHL
jgi:hypothetical protein